MNERLIFAEALSAVVDQGLFPHDSSAYKSIVAQLEYCLDYCDGVVDGSRLETMTLGVLTVRQFDGWKEMQDLLFPAALAAEKLAQQYSTKVSK